MQGPEHGGRDPTPAMSHSGPVGSGFPASEVCRPWSESNQSHCSAGVRWILELVAALLGADVDTFVPSGVAALLSAHEVATGKVHTLSSLCGEKSVQQKLSTERHTAMFEQLKVNSSARSRKLLLACSLPHASDWLIAPPVPGLGLGLQSEVFRTA